MKKYQKAFAEYEAVLGRRFKVIDNSDIQNPYNANITEYKTRSSSAVLNPSNQTEVAKIISIANKYKTPLFPFSTGKNWGLGSKLPIGKGQVLVDLKAMNRIRLIDEKLRFAIIEPGVTQKQLSDALINLKSNYMLPVTGSGNDTSIVGNMLERGVTGFYHRNELLIGLEVVLGNGKTIRTGHWHFFDEKNEQPLLFHPPGLGPDLNGLFCQSNFGIVTAMAIQLVPKRKGNIFYVETNEENLPKLFETFKRLKEENLLSKEFFITNKNDPRTARQQKYTYTGDWVGFGSFNGSPAMLELLRKEVKRNFKSFCCKIGFIDTNQPNEIFTHPYHVLLKKIYLGIPSNYSLETMAKMYQVKFESDDYNIDIYKDIPGFSVVLPAVPIESNKIMEVIKTMNSISEKMGVHVFHNFSTMNEMSLEGYFRIYFNRHDKNQIAIAHQWNKEVTEALKKINIFPYRLNNYQMSFFTKQPHDTYWSTLASLKKQLDPNNIIAPKKYNIV